MQINYITARLVNWKIFSVIMLQKEVKKMYTSVYNPSHQTLYIMLPPSSFARQWSTPMKDIASTLKAETCAASSPLTPDIFAPIPPASFYTLSPPLPSHVYISQHWYQNHTPPMESRFKIKYRDHPHHPYIYRWRVVWSALVHT